VRGTPLAVLLALVATLGYGAAFVLAQFALRYMSSWLGAAFSISTSTLAFWCLAPFLIDITKTDIGAAGLFACIGLFFPAAVTLLTFESNRLLGPNAAGAVAGLAPVFAVSLALLLLGETLRLPQLLAIAAVGGGVMLMYRGQQQTFRASSIAMLAVPLAAAVIRGAVQPMIKLGFASWPNPVAAVVIGYTISAIVLIAAALVRTGGLPRGFDRRGARWFAAVGICNGLAVLSTYGALGQGPVTLVSPIVASYPLITVLLSHLFLKEEPIGRQLLFAVAITVGGVILLIVT
jgi:drug/metabolite transporter (DMT)-like permease